MFFLVLSRFCFAYIPQGSERPGHGDSKGHEKQRDSLDDILGNKLGLTKTARAIAALRKGDAVEVFAAARAGEHTAPTPGVVRHVHADGFVDVELATGRMEFRRSPTEVRVLPNPKGVASSSSYTSAAAAASSRTASGGYVVGDRVEARYVTQGLWHLPLWMNVVKDWVGMVINNLMILAFSPETNLALGSQRTFLRYF